MKVRILLNNFYKVLSGAPPFYSKDRNEMFKNILEVKNFI